MLLCTVNEVLVENLAAPPRAAANTFHERYIPALDGVRGIAILVVLLHHCRFLLNGWFPAQLKLIRAFDIGWCGVVLFFVLSGFLITGILLDSKSSRNYFSTFYARRFLRIFPLYYGYLALVFLGCRAAHSLLGIADPVANINPWWYLTYIQNLRPNTMLTDPLLGHLWSLAVEEQFYVVWPLLIWLLPRRVLVWICAAMLPLSLAIRLLYAGTDLQLNAFVNTFTPASLDSLACGALIAMAARDPVWRSRVARIAHPLILVSAVWFSILAVRAGTLFIYQPLIQGWGITALTLLFTGLVFVAATSHEGAIPFALNIRPLKFLGKISYGLYVLHPLVYVLVTSLLAAVPVSPALDFALNSEKIILVFTTSIVVAAGSWFLFEKPILALKRYFRYEVPVGLSAAGE